MEKVDARIRIYCLKSPTSLEIRYIGMTSKTLKYRLLKHIDNAKYSKHNKHLCNWILSILRDNKKPIIEEIEIVNTDNWQDKEKYYISLYPNLLNANKGGEGAFGFKHSKETIEKLRNQKIGNKPSKETLLKRSNSLKGRIVTQEHREKISKSNTGVSRTKYKILVKDLLKDESNIYDSVMKTSNNTTMSEMTIRRNINKNTIVKNRYILVKI